MAQRTFWTVCVLLMAAISVQLTAAQISESGMSDLDSMKEDVAILKEKNEDLVTHVLSRIKSMDEKLGWCLVDESQTNVHQALLNSDRELKRDVTTLTKNMDRVQAALNTILTTMAPEITKSRLVGGISSAEGRLEVFHDGKWGTVCDDLFRTEDATPICRMLGFSMGTCPGCGPDGGTSSGNPAIHRTVAADGTGQIWMDSVDCPPEITSIDQCKHNGWGKEDCDHKEDVRLRCIP